jgi:hypothetical protein
MARTIVLLTMLMDTELSVDKLFRLEWMTMVQVVCGMRENFAFNFSTV